MKILINRNVCLDSSVSIEDVGLSLTTVQTDFYMFTVLIYKNQVQPCGFFCDSLYALDILIYRMSRLQNFYNESPVIK